MSVVPNMLETPEDRLYIGWVSAAPQGDTYMYIYIYIYICICIYMYLLISQ
jgi:hypothetical protein